MFTEKDLLKQVDEGIESAKTKLAWFMLSGHEGAVVDVDGAVALLQERVKDKDGEAMWMLGVCNEFGIGTEQDSERAMKLYKQSQNNGNEIGEYLANKEGKRILKNVCLWNEEP